MLRIVFAHLICLLVKLSLEVNRDKFNNTLQHLKTQGNFVPIGPCTLSSQSQWFINQEQDISINNNNNKSHLTYEKPYTYMHRVSFFYTLILLFMYYVSDLFSTSPFLLISTDIQCL